MASQVRRGGRRAKQARRRPFFLSLALPTFSPPVPSARTRGQGRQKGGGRLGGGVGAGAVRRACRPGRLRARPGPGRARPSSTRHGPTSRLLCPATSGRPVLPAGPATAAVWAPSDSHPLPRAGRGPAAAAWRGGGGRCGWGRDWGTGWTGGADHCYWRGTVGRRASAQGAIWGPAPPRPPTCRLRRAPRDIWRTPRGVWGP